jgi:hypothetical protein
MCDNEYDLCPVFVFYPAFHLSPLSFSCVMLLAAFSVLDPLSLPLLFFKRDIDKSYKKNISTHYGLLHCSNSTSMPRVAIHSSQIPYWPCFFWLSIA